METLYKNSVNKDVTYYIVSRLHVSSADGDTSVLNADFFNTSAQLFSSSDFPVKSFILKADAENYLKAGGSSYGIFVIKGNNYLLTAGQLDLRKISGNTIEKLLLHPFSSFQAKDNTALNPGFSHNVSFPTKQITPPHSPTSNIIC